MHTAVMKGYKTINITAKYHENPNMSEAVQVFLLPAASRLIPPQKSARGIRSPAGARGEISARPRRLARSGRKVKGQLERQPIKGPQF